MEAQTTAPSISLEQIFLRYDENILFQDFHLDITGGQCTCILGPSGCGKSTLLKMILGNAGLSYQGHIRIAGAKEKHHLSCAWMSQKDLLLPWLTVKENVLLGAQLRGEVSPDLQQKALELLREAGLGESGDSLPAVLSGGMRQRVALLRTLMEDRPVLLMDEPFSALDALTRLKLQDLTAKLTVNKTTVLVTHDPLEALRLGETIVILSPQPAQVVATLKPGGTVPRELDEGVLARDYPGLLATLLSAER